MGCRLSGFSTFPAASGGADGRCRHAERVIAYERRVMGDVVGVGGVERHCQPLVPVTRHENAHSIAKPAPADFETTLIYRVLAWDFSCTGGAVATAIGGLSR